MFSGGDYSEVARWLENFAMSHAKRENPRIEAVIEADGPREGRSYGIRLRAGERLLPPVGAPPLELSFEDARDHRGSLAWCEALAARVRELARGAEGARRSA